MDTTYDVIGPGHKATWYLKWLATGLVGLLGGVSVYHYLSSQTFFAHNAILHAVEIDSITASPTILALALIAIHHFGFRTQTISDIDKVSYKNKAGSGCFSTVYHAKRNGESVVIKFFRSEDVKEYTKDNLHHLHKGEIFGHRLTHQNLLQTTAFYVSRGRKLVRIDNERDFCEGDKIMATESPYLEGYQDLMKPGDFTEEQKKEIMRQVEEGVRYLHGLNYVHRDIKPNNILVKLKDDDTVEDVKIFDYSLLTEVDESGQLEEDEYMPEVNYKVRRFRYFRENEEPKQADNYACGAVAIWLGVDASPWIRDEGTRVDLSDFFTTYIQRVRK